MWSKTHVKNLWILSTDSFIRKSSNPLIHVVLPQAIIATTFESRWCHHLSFKERRTIEAEDLDKNDSDKGFRPRFKVEDVGSLSDLDSSRIIETNTLSETNSSNRKHWCWNMSFLLEPSFAGSQVLKSAMGREIHPEAYNYITVDQFRILNALKIEWKLIWSKTCLQVGQEPERTNKNWLKEMFSPTAVTTGLSNW